MNVYAQRLLNVARATREATDQFDMGNFAHPCGTPACALGNYAVRSDLQDDFMLINAEPANLRARWWPVHLESANWDGCDSRQVHEYFGLRSGECWSLFGPHGCDNAGRDNEKAAAFIEAFVARKWPIDPAVAKLESELTIDPAPLPELVS